MCSYMNEQPCHEPMKTHRHAAKGQLGTIPVIISPLTTTSYCALSDIPLYMQCAQCRPNMRVFGQMPMIRSTASGSSFCLAKNAESSEARNSLRLPCVSREAQGDSHLRINTDGVKCSSNFSHDAQYRHQYNLHANLRMLNATTRNSSRGAVLARLKYKHKESPEAAVQPGLSRPTMRRVF